MIIAITQYITAIALIPHTQVFDVLGNWHFALLVSGTILIAAGGYIINDYYDVKIDYVNKPGRVVVGKYFGRRTILVAHTSLSVIGVLFGLLVSYWVGAVNLVVTGILWLYSNQLKRLPFLGNLSIAFLTGLSVFVVYLFYRESLFLIIAYTSFAFFMSLIREIVKDFEDIEGDEKFNCRTLPIVLGIRKTKLIIYTAMIVLILLVALLLRKEPAFVYVLGGLFLTLFLLTYMIIMSDTVRRYRRLSQMCKVIMIFGTISMLLFI